MGRKQKQTSRSSSSSLAYSRKKTHTSSPQTQAALSAYLSPLGKILLPVPSDGNCLFSSISSWLAYNSVTTSTASTTDCAAVREMICRELLKKKSLYEPFFTPKEENDDVGDEDYEDVQDVDYDSYVSRMAKDGEWGGQLELLAASMVFKRAVKVYVCGADMEVTVNLIDEQRRGRRIEVAFDGVGHYVGVGSLRKDKCTSSEDEDEREESSDEGSADNLKKKRDNSPVPPASKNDPCHCESKKPYKRCCMKADQARARARARVRKADEKRRTERERKEADEEDEEVVEMMKGFSVET